MSFTPENVQERLRQQPLMPFRLVTTTDQVYDIHHPDLVLVGQRFLMVGTPTSDSPKFPDSVTRVALMHVTELRDLPTPAGSPPANGTT